MVSFCNEGEVQQGVGWGMEARETIKERGGRDEREDKRMVY